MQDLDSDLFNFDTFYSVHNTEDGVDDLWALAATSVVCHEDDLLDLDEFQPFSPLKEQFRHEQEQIQVKQVSANKLGLTIDTKLDNTTDESLKANGTPTATLPARFALLSTKCVYEPGFTTSPRGKRRISQLNTMPTLDQQIQSEPREASDNDEEVAGGEDEPFILSDTDGNGLPVFTEAELLAMVESPSKLSTASTSSAVLSPLHLFAHEETPYGNPFIGYNSTKAEPMGPEADKPEPEISNVIDMLNSIYESSQHSQQHSFDLSDITNSSFAVPPNILAAASQSLLPIDMTSVNPVIAAPNAATNPNVVPYDLLSPPGYAAAANQFLDNFGQQIHPFFLNTESLVNAALFHSQQVQTDTANAQLAAAVAMANSAAMDTMLKMNGVSMLHRSGSMPPTTKVKIAAPLKPRPSIQRAVSATRATASLSNRGGRLAFTPDIADFKLVQIFHQFCDPATKVLTLPRFQQMMLHHQIKEETTNKSDFTSNVAADAQTLFTSLVVDDSGSIGLEHFMNSFQICNRCTEIKRRAYQALCASQGQTITSTALERQLMEDVVPVVVRVVPTHFEGHKVKSCEHYQWTWCEGFDKTGNEKCRGTNRHDKCPKYLANCTLWKHKLPPKSRKPKVLLDNVDSPTKKLKHFS